TCAILSVVLALLAGMVGARAGEEKVPLDKLPKVILDAIKARFEGAELRSAAKEKEDDKTVFEVAIKHKGHKIDVTLTPEGTILGIEKEIAAKDLPKAVAKTLEEKYPKAIYKIIEEVIKVEKKVEKLVYYEVQLVTTEKNALEVQVAPDGKFLKEE